MRSKFFAVALGLVMSTGALAFDLSSATTQFCGSVAGKWSAPGNTAGVWTITQDASGNLGGQLKDTGAFNCNPRHTVYYNITPGSGFYNTTNAAFAFSAALVGGAQGTCPATVTVNGGYIPLHDAGCSEAYFGSFGNMTAQSCVVPNGAPTGGGVTTFKQWDPNFPGLAQFTETLTPPAVNGTQLSTYNWSGRSVTESFSSVVSTGCNPDLTNPPGATWYIGLSPWPAGTGATNSLVDFFGFSFTQADAPGGFSSVVGKDERPALLLAPSMPRVQVGPGKFG
jgi:hypothetical protein